MTNTTTTGWRSASAATVLAALLTDAEAAGLPEPFAYDGVNYLDRIGIQVDPDEFEAWMAFLGTDTFNAKNRTGVATHMSAEAVVDGFTIRLAAIRPLTVHETVNVPLIGSAS